MTTPVPNPPSSNDDAEALVQSLLASLAEMLRLIAKSGRAARRAQRRNKRQEASP